MSKKSPFIFMALGFFMLTFSVVMASLSHSDRTISANASGAVWGAIMLIAGIYLFTQKRIQARIEHRKNNNLCVHCGYDLRGSRVGYRCSECGKVIW